MDNIGEAIRSARKKAGMTQDELAAKLSTTKSAISKYELGKREPNIEQLRRIAIALGVSVSDLVDSSYWSLRNEAEKKSAFSLEPYKEIMVGLMDKLNDAGQQKAVERVEELTEIPKYQKEPIKE